MIDMTIFTWISIVYTYRNNHIIILIIIILIRLLLLRRCSD